MPSIFDEIVEKVIEMRLATPTELIGCTAEEIEEIKAHQNVKRLPEVYLEFLRKMGKEAGRFLDVDFFYPGLLKMKLEAQEILQDTAPSQQLPDDAFVLYAHHGYEFIYFLTETALDDPPIYHYLEGASGEAPLPATTKI